MLSKTNTIQSRWIALALFPLSSFAIPSVAESSPRVVHVFVALADNQHQGIIPVPPALGNGRDPQRNLYWGAAYGVKTYFKASEDWELAWSGRGAHDAILERCVFKSSKNDVYLVADAYEGSQIKLAVTDFLSAAAGIAKQRLSLKMRSGEFPSPSRAMRICLFMSGMTLSWIFRSRQLPGSEETSSGKRLSSRVPASPFSLPISVKLARSLCYGRRASWLRRPTR